MGLRKTAERTMHLSLIDACLVASALTAVFLLEIFFFIALGLDLKERPNDGTSSDPRNPSLPAPGTDAPPSHLS